MAEDEVLSKFYKELTPFSDIVHLMGLMHTARVKDIGYAKSLLSSSFKQKTSDYCSILFFESTLKGRPVLVFKVVKEGDRNFKKQTDKFLSWLEIEYSHEKLSSQCFVYLDTKKNVNDLVFSVKKKLLLSASIAGFKYILTYDLAKEKQRLWSRKFSSSK